MCVMPRPRLYMHTLQYATYNKVYETVTFVTRLANGRHFHFELTKNQFLALNDAILLIDRENAYGHYPLGRNTWIHYNAFDASLYKEKTHERIYFNFASFHEYKKYTHRRLLLLIRLQGNVEAAADVRRRRRKRNARYGGDDSSENDVGGCQRPLSTTVQASNQSATTKRSRRGEGDPLCRSSNDADMSANEEESPIFSEWHYSNTRRRSDSISPLSFVAESDPSS